MFGLFSLSTFSQSDTSLIVRDSTFVADSLQIAMDTTVKTKPQLSILSKEEDKVEIDSSINYYFLGEIQNFKLGQQLHDDTLINNEQVFDPLKVDYGMFSTLSNLGLAHKSLVLEPQLNTGYNTDIESFNKYIFHNNEIKYYKLYIPVTKIAYVMGSKKEQNLNVTLNREIIHNLFFGFDYRLNNSPGPYLNSQSNNTRVNFTMQFYTNNMRYGVIANYRNNRVRVEENGGLVSDSLFENNVESDRRLLDVNLETAEQKLINSGFYIEQYFNLLKPKAKNDSSSRKIDVGHISHSIYYNRNQLIYSDQEVLSDFYSPYFPPIDSTETFDSCYQSILTNKFKWSSLGYNEDKLSKIFHINFGIQHDLISQTLAYDSVASSYYQLKPFAGISLNLFKSMHLNAYGELVLGSYAAGDYKLKAEIEQYLGNEEKNLGKIDGSLTLLSREADWWLQNYQSNRFRWTNDFDKETSMSIAGSYSFNMLKAGFQFNTFNNYTYLNDSVLPEQATKAETHLKVYAQADMMIKKFGFNTLLVYQKSSLPLVLSVPDFSAILDIHFRSSIFKNAAIVQIGLHLNYFTKFYAKAYMPELRAFYVQNEKKIGGYPFVDAYLNLQVKRAILFVKIANLTSYMGNYNYYNAPSYPARDARFYFGVSWRFLN